MDIMDFHKQVAKFFTSIACKRTIELLELNF